LEFGDIKPKFLPKKIDAIPKKDVDRKDLREKTMFFK
jgi:hypothetical protein